MKREIWCIECQKKNAMKIAATAAKHCEFFQTLKGKLKAPRAVCDFCCFGIAQGDECYAVSFAPTELEYKAWESEYLELNQ